MVIVPVLGLVLALTAIEKQTVPSPLPLLPMVIVSQGALLLAVQTQPLPAVTLTLPIPPLAGPETLEGEME
jgi:hypothetical protein